MANAERRVIKAPVPGRDAEWRREQLPPAGGSREGWRLGGRFWQRRTGAGISEHGARRVLATEGSGDDSKLTIYFDEVGKRKLVVKYAALEYL